MSKQFDIVIFGATGFTGARVLKYLTQSNSTRKIAIAGRSRTKLEQVWSAFGPSTGPETDQILSDVDISKPASILKMAQTTKVVLNCVGPYRLYGEPVVQACVVAGTDYLDVCGEPEFMETMQLKYGAAAKEAKCFITSAVGFDCIPADVGAALAVSAMHDKGLKPHTVDSFLIIDWGPAGACGHFATLAVSTDLMHTVVQCESDHSCNANGNRNKVTVEVSGPEPGYIATPLVLVEAAEELLENKAAIQAVAGQGGVTTPGALLLMHGSSYVERLKAAGIGITVTPE